MREFQGYLLTGLKKAQRGKWSWSLSTSVRLDEWPGLGKGNTLRLMCFFVFFLPSRIKKSDRESCIRRCLASGFGTGTSGWGRMVEGNPCKHQALSEGMKGLGVTHCNPPPIPHIDTPNPTLPSLCSSIFLLNQLVFLFYSDLILPMLCWW